MARDCLAGQGRARKGEIDAQCAAAALARPRRVPLAMGMTRKNSSERPAAASVRQRPAPQLADYPHRVADIIRFGDLDPQGHVNQAVFLTYFESGRVAMFRDQDLGIGVPGVTFVMVRMEVDYMKELRWPGTIEIGTGVAEFGRSSFKVGAGDLPRRRLRCDRPRHAGLHGRQDAQGDAAAGRGHRAAEQVED